MLYLHRPVHEDRMRRVLVIVLVLLFPLNVFALSMSASLLQAGFAPAPTETAASAPDIQAGQGLSCALACDLDPDEPPGHQDLHDIVHVDAAQRMAGPADRAAFSHDASRPGYSPPPPVKPPRA